MAPPVFSGGLLAAAVRMMLLASGALALARLGGLVAGDMRLRSIGIFVYVGVFPVAALLLAVLFDRATPNRSGQ